jgi:alpha-L-arabinofuranosidase
VAKTIRISYLWPMKNAAFLLLLPLICGTPVFAQNKMVLNADLGRDTISHRIYGHFAEHLGRCVYDGFYVGEKSTIPNTDGVRNDLIEALKKMKVGTLRWPGGCFADTYQWKDGIGPKENRPKMVNIWWGGVTEDNSFGTHDFLNLCERLQTEPYLAGNVGSGTVKDFTDWVAYTNHRQGSPMSEWRIKNGREKPWNVKIWGVGNEAWGCGGNMRPEYYANIYRQYATFMTDWSNSSKIFRVASGASDADYHWTEVLMRDIPHQLMEAVALHHYSVIDWNNKGSAALFTEEQYFKTMKTALDMRELVTRHATIMDKYDPKKKIALFVDEWGGWYDIEPGTNPGFLYQQNTMRDALLAGATLNIFHDHCDRVRGANLAQTVNVLQAVALTEGEKLILTPTYHVLEMYNVHQDALQLPIQNMHINQYVQGTEKLPAISASASKDTSGKIHISLVNIDLHQTQEVSITLRGTTAKTVSGRILTSEKVQNHNTFAQPDRVKTAAFKSASIKNDVLQVALPPASVVVLELGG